MIIWKTIASFMSFSVFSLLAEWNKKVDVMARLDAMENELHTEKREHKEDVERLNAKIEGLTQENQLLRDGNARLKSIINNDSSNFDSFCFFHNGSTTKEPNRLTIIPIK
ncbi:MAG: hypothetical protein K2N73_06810 [Lachnospiraceae bacterium]|nr:hypothetical protein [Lachnospiraceae bacterium]